MTDQVKKIPYDISAQQSFDYKTTTPIVRNPTFAYLNLVLEELLIKWHYEQEVCQELRN
jgi:hypothetical protein